MDIITSDVAIRNRMREIKTNRDKFVKGNEGVILDSVSFMEIVNKYLDSRGTYLHADNPMCSFKGFYSVDEYVDFVCPIEDLSEEDISKIDCEALANR